ncbi:MAG: CDP-alcohol phosphatidyltransferase family protein [Anaerolineales bacterium]|nr:CDP-alcohol phosphatidyltransferase family protein [Anaerolineales bacterium]
MANLITLLRFPLLFMYIAILYFGNQTVLYWGIPFLIVIFLMDYVDGFIARRFGEVSLFGSTFDIVTDRTLEIVLWVVFSDLGLIPIIIPIIAIVRGTTVDGIRAVGMSKGLAAFDQVRTPISRFLVSSRLMRELYGITKTLAFVLLNITLAMKSGQAPHSLQVHQATLWISWLAIILNVTRGLPVLFEGGKFFRKQTAR